MSPDAAREQVGVQLDAVNREIAEHFDTLELLPASLESERKTVLTKIDKLQERRWTLLSTHNTLQAAASLHSPRYHPLRAVHGCQS